MIDQLTVFLENTPGRLVDLAKTLGDANISMHALTVAETADYGIARIISDTPEAASSALNSAGFRTSITPVLAIAVEEKAGGLAAVLNVIYQANYNVEYAYCYQRADKTAVDIVKLSPAENNTSGSVEQAAEIIKQAGYQLLTAQELYTV